MSCLLLVLQISSLAQEFLRGTILDPTSAEPILSGLQTHSSIAPPGAMAATTSGVAETPTPVRTTEEHTNVPALIFPHIPKMMSRAGGKTGEVAYAKELLHEACFELSQKAAYGAWQRTNTVHPASRHMAVADHHGASEAAW